MYGRLKPTVRTLTIFAFILMTGLPAGARQQNPTFKTPPVKIPLTIKDQRVTIVTSTNITLVGNERGTNLLKLDITADLRDLQQNATNLLISQLDAEERCGDRIAIQHATLSPRDPSSLAIVQFHFERWACIKLLGKQDPKKLVAGNAVLQLKLTPIIEKNNTELRLGAEVTSMEADGSLGELLRSGVLGPMLEDKIKNAVQSAMQKGADLGATLPPAARGYVSIQNAQFRNAGAGRLDVILSGEIRISNEQLQSLTRQLKDQIQKP